MDSLFFRLRTIFKVFWVYIFYFPGLVLHEGSHALAAFVTFSKITKISLFPTIHFAPDDSAYKVTYGYVRSVASYKAAYMLIGLAPFLLWLIPVWIAIYLGWVSLNPIHITTEKIFQLKNWWFLLLVFQISWAGFPSKQDWNVFFEGLLSISGIITIALVTIYFASSGAIISELPLWKMLP